MKPISVQLYSLRQFSEKDFIGVLKRVAAIGYKGVEPAGFFGLSARELKKIVTDLGMVISSSHTPWIGSVDNVQEGIDTAAELGLDCVCTGYGPDDFIDLDAIKATADKVNAIIARLQGSGITLFMHNHYWEFERINGRIKYDYFFDLCPNVMLEIDTYWAANFGAENPAEQVAKYTDRTILLHIKDGNFCKEKHLLQPVGDGKNAPNIEPVIAAANQNKLRWLVVEQDDGEGDMFANIEKSYKYLTSRGIAQGNK